MTEHLITSNAEWVPDHTVEELRAKSKAAEALLAEMKAARVLVVTGGLDHAAPVFGVDASSGTPLFTDGPFIESKEHLGGFAVVDVADEAAARLWAGKIAVACGWPQQVRRFPIRMQLPKTSQRRQRAGPAARGCGRPPNGSGFLAHCAGRGPLSVPEAVQEASEHATGARKWCGRGRGGAALHGDRPVVIGARNGIHDLLLVERLRAVD